jgi:hypothetical protein
VECKTLNACLAWRSLAFIRGSFSCAGWLIEDGLQAGANPLTSQAMQRGTLIAVFIVVFGAGGLAGWWLGRSQASRAFAAQTAQATHAAAASARTSGEVRGRSQPLDQAAPNGGTASGETEGNPVDQDDGPIPAEVQEAAAKKRQRRIEERLAALKSRLQLSDAQAAHVRPLIEKLIPDYAQMIARIAEEKPGPDQTPSDPNFFKMFRPPGARDPEFDTALDALLTTDQRVAYATFQEEQRANQIEMNANRELARLQGIMTLSADQKDKVFAVLSEVAGKELDQPIEEKDFEPERLAQRQAQRVEALKPLLLPEQLAVYESSPFDVMEMLGPMIESFDFTEAIGEEQ